MIPPPFIQSSKPPILKTFENPFNFSLSVAIPDLMPTAQ